MSALTVISQLQQLVKACPDRPVFEQNAHSLTAAELDRRSSEVALQLHQLGVSPADNIAVVLPRGLEASIAIYAILKLGACYVPVDTHNPISRQKYIVTDANCRCIVGERNSPDWINELKIDYLDIRQRQNGQYTLTDTHLSREQNAAILYTSGSTGLPKGVVISNRAILSFCKWAQHSFSIDSKVRIANLTPFHFDLSLFDLFAGPLSGATTVYMPESLKFAPAKLVDWLIDQSISCWYTVPSILGFIVFKGGLGTKSAPDLKQILFAGEVFATPKLIKLTELLPDTTFYNLFGPTETNVCLYWPVDKKQLQADKAIPIGSPACDADLKICPQHRELLVKGPCLMTGYWKQGHIELPLDDQGWYHTGDQVSITTQGHYQYQGRLDRMIKSAGYRVEPAEIELALNSITGVDNAAVTAIDDPLTGSRIMAVIAGTNIDRKLIKTQIQEKLPAYMHPGKYLFVDSLPILSNGKIDYRTITTMIQTRQNQ